MWPEVDFVSPPSTPYRAALRTDPLPYRSEPRPCTGFRSVKYGTRKMVRRQNGPVFHAVLEYNGHGTERLPKSMQNSLFQEASLRTYHDPKQMRRGIFIRF